MHLDSKKVLVTGAGGFIGSHLIEAIVERGADTAAFVRYNSRNDCGMLENISKEAYSSIEIVSGDLRDSNTVSKAVKDVDVIFHLGALIAIPYSYSSPRDVVETNIRATLNVLDAAREHGTEKVVHTSTSEVYGSARYVPINESHPLQGQSPYSASKIAADKVAEAYHCSFGLPVATVRPFNTYGPRQSARAVIPTIISQALVEDSISLGSLHPKRDLTYVSDTVDGFIMAAESEASVGEVINLGTNEDITIGELAKKILHILGSDKEIVSSDDRVRPDNSEVLHLRSDNSKARELIGWSPKVSLDEGLSRTIDWIRDNISDYKTDQYVR